MNKHIYYIYITALILMSLLMITGCSTYLAGMSDPVILSRSPSLEATGVPSNEDIIITFNKIMDTTVNLGNAIKFDNPYNTAGIPTSYTTIEWSTDGKTLSIIDPGDWTGGDGSRVYWTVSKEAFMDENGKAIIENAVIVDYSLSGFGIIGRSPYRGEQNVSHPRTLEVTFSMPVDPMSLASFPFSVSSEHTADFPYPYPPTTFEMYLTNGNRTLNWYVASWETHPALVAIIVTPEGVISDETDTYVIPGGTMLWYYGNSN